MLIVPRRTVEFPFHELYQFDNETGLFSNRIYIRDSINTSSTFFTNGYSHACFSPDSKKLYISLGTRNRLNPNTGNTVGFGTIWQYDVSQYNSGMVAESKIYIGRLYNLKPNVGLTDPTTPMMQLAMNGKIYVSPGIPSLVDSFLTVINCPNSKGANCNIEWRKHKLIGLNGAYFPTLNQTFVRNAGIFQLQANKRSLCVGDTLELSGYGAGAEKFRWSVSPALPQTVQVDTLTWQKLDTKNIPPRDYTFSCVASSKCGDNYVESMVVTVKPKPVPPALAPPLRGGGGGASCIGDSVFIKTITSQIGYKYFWSSGDTASQIVVKKSGKYSLDSVANAFGCGIKVKDTVSVVIKDAPKPAVPVLLSPKVNEICEGQEVQLTINHLPFTIHKWNTGQTGESILVDSAGLFAARAINDEGCISNWSDTTSVKIMPNPKPVFINIDSVLQRESLQNQNYCVAGQAGSTFSFSVTGGQKVDSSENCVSVNWSVPPSGARGPVLAVQVTETLSNPACFGSVSQTFTYRPNLKIPSLITPNGDGKNDVFEIEDLAFYGSHSYRFLTAGGRRCWKPVTIKMIGGGRMGFIFIT